MAGGRLRDGDDLCRVFLGFLALTLTMEGGGGGYDGGAVMP